MVSAAAENKRARAKCSLPAAFNIRMVCERSLSFE